jgi:hypothetical protein
VQHDAGADGGFDLGCKRTPGGEKTSLSSGEHFRGEGLSS